MDFEINHNRHFYWAISLWGEDFYPSKLLEDITFPLERIREKGQTALKGRYRGKKYPNSSATIIAPDNLNYHEKVDYLLSILEQNKNLFLSYGVTEIELDHAYYYESQVNLGYDVGFLKRVAKLDIPFIISCYQIDSAEDLPKPYLIS